MDIDVTIEGIKTDKNGKEYVSNPYLLKQLILSKEQDELTKEALNMFMLMIKNISSKKRYPSKEEEEDCQATAMLDVLQYWRSFDPTKGDNPNPFAYFTSLITNGIAKGWNMLHPENKKAEGAIFTSIDNGIYTL